MPDQGRESRPAGNRAAITNKNVARSIPSIHQATDNGQSATRVEHVVTVGSNLVTVVTTIAYDLSTVEGTRALSTPEVKGVRETDARNLRDATKVLTDLEHRCRRCRAILTAAKSVALQLGPVCRIAERGESR